MAAVVSDTTSLIPLAGQERLNLLPKAVDSEWRKGNCRRMESTKPSEPRKTWFFSGSQGADWPLP
jgi:hypothetical protein